MLLLNGGMMSYASWAPIAAALAEHYRVVLCDLRGQLLSPGPVPADLAGNLDDLAALLDSLEIDSAHVMGTSYGGEIGLLAAALMPQRVRSLVAVTVSDYATRAIYQGVEDLRLLVHGAREGGERGLIHDRLVEEVYSDAYRKEHAEELAERRGQIASLPESWFEGLEGILTAVERLDVRPHLGRIECPTLVVIAADDQSIPPERSRAVAAAISGSETRVHETSGHALVAEDPEWLATVTLDFFSRHSNAD